MEFSEDKAKNIDSDLTSSMESGREFLPDIQFIEGSICETLVSQTRTFSCKNNSRKKTFLLVFKVDRQIFLGGRSEETEEILLKPSQKKQIKYCPVLPQWLSSVRWSNHYILAGIYEIRDLSD